MLYVIVTCAVAHLPLASKLVVKEPLMQQPPDEEPHFGESPASPDFAPTFFPLYNVDILTPSMVQFVRVDDSCGLLLGPDLVRKSPAPVRFWPVPDPSSALVESHLSWCSAAHQFIVEFTEFQFSYLSSAFDSIVYLNLINPGVVQMGKVSQPLNTPVGQEPS